MAEHHRERGKDFLTRENKQRNLEGENLLILCSAAHSVYRHINSCFESRNISH